MNNDENETVRQTLERVMRERGYLKPENQTILQTPIGDFSYQISEQTPPSTGEAGQYFIKDDKNYAWDMPKQAETIPSTQSQPSRYTGVPIAALTGTAEGIVGGLERVANGLSGGTYGSFVDKNMNNSYTNRQNKLQNQANYAGVGYLHNIANTIIDTDADIAKYYYGAKFGNKFIK